MEGKEGTASSEEVTAAPERPRASSKPEALAFQSAMLAKLEASRLAKLGAGVTIPGGSSSSQDGEEGERRRLREDQRKEEELARFEEARRVAEENARREADQQRKKTECGATSLF